MGAIISFFSDQNTVDEERRKSFVLLDYNDVYETRMYESQCWISTTVNREARKEYQGDIRLSMKKLKRYLHGRNAKNMYMGDDNFVICKVMHPSVNEDQITVSMVLPGDFKNNPPGPLTNEIFLEEQQQRLIYATKVGRSTNEDERNQAYLRAKKALDCNEESYVDGICYRVQYIKKYGRKPVDELWVIGEAVEKGYVCLKNDDDIDD